MAKKNNCGDCKLLMKALDLICPILHNLESRGVIFTKAEDKDWERATYLIQEYYNK